MVTQSNKCQYPASGSLVLLLCFLSSSSFCVGFSIVKPQSSASHTCHTNQHFPCAVTPTTTPTTPPTQQSPPGSKDALFHTSFPPAQLRQPVCVATQLAALPASDPNGEGEGKRSAGNLFQRALSGLRSLRVRWMRVFRRRVLPLLLAATLFFGNPTLPNNGSGGNGGGYTAPFSFQPPAAVAVGRSYDPPATGGIGATSLRPGMSKEQVQQLEKGEITRDQVTLEFNEQSSNNAMANLENTPAKAAQRAQEMQQVDDDDYENYDEDSLKVREEDYSSTKTLFEQSSSKRKNKRQKDALRGVQMQSNFAMTQRTSEAAAQTKLAVSLSVMVPVFGGTLLREYFRRQREANYVKKGLEIQRAQYAEYFNITSETDDSDIEDALKELKNNNETDTSEGEDGEDDEDAGDDTDESGDDDNDNDDDDDDDDIDPSASSSRRNPKRPPGGGDGSGGAPDSSGDGSDGGGGVSDEDLDRLNAMFKKS